jgi:glycosyltransferase involved in cell wall biosynthesis
MDGIEVHRLPFMPSQAHNRLLRLGSLFTLTLSLWRRGLALLRDAKPDWVVLSSPPLPLALAGSKLARKVGAKVLLNISDLWPLTAKELGALKPGMIYSALEGLERNLLRSADAWTGQSDEILSYIRKAAGVSCPDFLYRNLGPARSQQMAIPTGAVRRIVYAGLVGPVQGIAPIAMHTDFKALGLELHIYGDGPDRKKLEQFVKKHPERGIELHHTVSPDAMSELLPQYDLALVPLRKPIYGAVPSKLFAAIGSGVPVLFCGGGEGARIVQEHGLGWVCPAGDETCIVNTLRAIVAMPAEELAAVHEQCIKASAGAFSRDDQDAAFLHFLEAVTATKKAGSPVGSLLSSAA